jgi:hypothetical protein
MHFSEAPVPVVRFDRDEYRLGGAANVAHTVTAPAARRGSSVWSAETSGVARWHGRWRRRTSTARPRHRRVAADDAQAAGGDVAHQQVARID